MFPFDHAFICYTLIVQLKQPLPIFNVDKETYSTHLTEHPGPLGAATHLRFVHVGVKNILAATVDVHSRLVHVQAG